MAKFISWRRVSTHKQSKSGLGLEAQKEIIRYFVERENGELIADYAECYTGTDLSGCTELRRAIAHSKREGAILVIAKTDRFRNTIEALQVFEEMGDGNIMFCDLPHTDKFSLTLFFALAEREALIVSIRTRQALAVKKANGAELGAAGAAYRSAMANKTAEELAAIGAKRGQTRTRRHLQSRDAVAMLKILRRVFPDATAGEPTEWHWDAIRTAGAAKGQIIGLMQDYHDMDDTGATFARWSFSGMTEREKQQKLSAQIISLRNSVMKQIV